MGKGVELALECMSSRKEEYKKWGRDYYQPVLVIIGDGKATDNIVEVSQRVRDMVIGKKLTVICVDVGASQESVENLQNFSPLMPVFQMKGLRFAQFFR